MNVEAIIDPMWYSMEFRLQVKRILYTNVIIMYTRTNVEPISRK